MPRQKRPVYFEQLTMYKELRTFAEKFGQGLYNCLIVVGPPGKLKTSIFMQATGDKAHLISGHATPCEVFCEAQKHKDELLVIDDADGFTGESAGQRFLKQITNPKKPARCSWTSNEPEKRGLDKVFCTSSPVAIIDNAWHVQTEHVVALEDRGRLLLFVPPPAEVHREMDEQDWFTDEKIYKFVGDNLGFFNDLSVRAYVKAEEAKKAGEDWRAYLLKTCGLRDADLQLLLIEYEGPNESVEHKCQEWMKRTGQSRATYFRKKQELMVRIPGHPLVGKWSLGG